jgi:DNA-binding transcriptional ArsR family regulator
MTDSSNFAATASLLADPARAIMLTALLDGRALPAGELAFAAGITAQTASSHLAKLLQGGILLVETEGRHRYYRLAGSRVAQALEQLSSLRQSTEPRRKALTPQARQLRFCRCCYDHLAGQVGVAVAGAMVARDYLRPAPDKQFEVTPAGADWFGALGLDLCAIRPTKRGLARQCLDWTERTHHLAGPLGVELMAALCRLGWLRRAKDSRAVAVTPKGWVEFKRQLGVDFNGLSPEAGLREFAATA